MTTEPRPLAQTETSNGAHTQYLVIYGTGAVTCDVHEMIVRHVYDDDVPVGDPYEITGTMMILPDREAPIWVNITDYDNGLSWEIVRPGGETVLERVCYLDETRRNTSSSEVFVVGFPEPPNYIRFAAANVD